MTHNIILDDSEYIVQNGKAVVQLWGRATTGRRTCVRVHDFEPYFYAVPGQGQELPTLKESIRKIAIEDFSITDVREVKRLVNESERTVLQVIVNLPKAVPKLRELVARVPGINSIHEYDILYARRFLIDKGLVPGTLLAVKGHLVKEHELYDAITADEITTADSQPKLKPRVLALDIEVYYPEGSAFNPEKQPILMIALYGENYEKVLTWRKGPAYPAYVEVLDSERDILEAVCKEVNSYDPDYIVGYHSDGFDFPFLIKRAKSLKVELPLGIDGSEPDEGPPNAQPVATMRGRCHIDVLKFVRNVFGKSMQTDSYALEAVAQEVLGEGKHPIDIALLAKAWDDYDKSLVDYATYNLKDTELTYRLFQIMFPNILELVRLVGQPITEITRMSYSRLVEWYVMRYAVPQGHVFPNRPTKAQSEERRLERAKGAFVFEPTPGYYEDLAVFDYRSLYPSIIASHNISPGTLRCPCCKEVEEAKVPKMKPALWFCKKRQGFLSGIIGEIILTRAKIKQEIKKNPDNFLLEARSGGLKILANAFYGYIGFAEARWYSHDCVEGVTAWGRHYITSVISQAREQGFQVIYSDTDSVFLTLGKKTLDETKAFAHMINEKLPGLMELDFEGTYKSGIFVATKFDASGAKKRYALIDAKGKLKIKGFESVRRNFSPLGKRLQISVLKILLQGKNTKEATEVVKKALGELKDHTIPVAELIIHTRLSKSPQAYKAATPSVAAAMRLVARGKKINPGTPFDFVVIKGEGKISDRVRLADEESAKDYDDEYYRENQILPAVERIFEVVGVNIREHVAGIKQRSLSNFFE